MPPLMPRHDEAIIINRRSVFPISRQLSISDWVKQPQYSCVKFIATGPEHNMSLNYDRSSCVRVIDVDMTISWKRQRSRGVLGCRPHVTVMTVFTATYLPVCCVFRRSGLRKDRSVQMTWTDTVGTDNLSTRSLLTFHWRRKCHRICASRRRLRMCHCQKFHAISVRRYKAQLHLKRRRNRRWNIVSFRHCTLTSRQVVTNIGRLKQTDDCFLPRKNLNSRQTQSTDTRQDNKTLTCTGTEKGWFNGFTDDSRTALTGVCCAYFILSIALVHSRSCCLNSTYVKLTSHTSHQHWSVTSRCCWRRWLTNDVRLG